MLQYWGGVLKKKFVKFVVQDLTSGGIDWQREKWQSGLGSKFIHQGEKNAVKYADEVIVLSKVLVINPIVLAGIGFYSTRKTIKKEIE